MSGGGECHQNAIAHQLDDAPVAFGDIGFNQLFALGLERSQSARLVLANKAAVADHVGGENGDQTAFQPRSPFRE